MRARIGRLTWAPMAAITSRAVQAYVVPKSRAVTNLGAGMQPVRAKIGYFRALARYFRDPQAGFFGKASIFMAVAYVLMPLDLIPDVAPIIGWLDDLGVVAMALGHLAKTANQYRDASVVPQLPAGHEAEGDDGYALPEKTSEPRPYARMSEEELRRRFRELEQKA